MINKIKDNLGVIIEELDDLQNDIGELEFTTIHELHDEILRIRRDLNELVITELTLLLEDGKNNEREKVES